MTNSLAQLSVLASFCSLLWFAALLFNSSHHFLINIHFQPQQAAVFTKTQLWIPLPLPCTQQQTDKASEHLGAKEPDISLRSWVEMSDLILRWPETWLQMNDWTVVCLLCVNDELLLYTVVIYCLTSTFSALKWQKYQLMYLWQSLLLNIQAAGLLFWVSADHWPFFWSKWDHISCPSLIFLLTWLWPG